MSPGPLCNVTGHPTAFEQVAAYTNMGELALLQKLQNLGHPEILLEDVAEFFFLTRCFGWRTDVGYVR